MVICIAGLTKSDDLHIMQIIEFQCFIKEILCISSARSDKRQLLAVAALRSAHNRYNVCLDDDMCIVHSRLNDRICRKRTDCIKTG